MIKFTTNKKSLTKVTILIFFIAFLVVLSFKIAFTQEEIFPFTITERTEYGLTENTVYIDFEDNLDKDQYISNITFDFADSDKTRTIEIKDFMLNQSHLVNDYGLVNVSLGKYKNIITNTTEVFYEFENTTINETNSYYFDSSDNLLCKSIYINETESITLNGTENVTWSIVETLQTCDYILPDKSVLKLERQVIGNHIEYDYLPTPNTKEKIVYDGLKIEQKVEGSIPMPKGSSAQIRISMPHLLFYGINVEDWENKYNITACSQYGCSTLDPAWWDANYDYKKQITITNNHGSSAVEIGYTVNITMDTRPANTNVALTSGDDVRIVYNGATELDRIACEGTSWNSASTEICFKTQASIADSGSDNNYYVYYGNTLAGAAPDNGSNVYVFYDDFEGTSLDTSKWVWVDNQGGLEVSNSILHFWHRTTSFQIHWEKVYSIQSWGIGFKLGFRGYFIGAFQNAMGWYDGVNLVAGNRDSYTDIANLRKGTSPSQYWAYRTRSQGIPCTDVTQRAIQSDFETWSTWYIARTTDNVKWWKNQVLLDLEHACIPTVSLQIGGPIMTYEQPQGHQYWDWAFVSKYISPEPTTSLGGEEEHVPEITIHSPTNTTYTVNTTDFNVSFNEGINYTVINWDGLGNFSLWLRGNTTLNRSYENTSLLREAVSYWTFDECTGDVLFDSNITNGNNGTLTGTSSLPNWTNSEISGCALEFDGSEDLVNVSDDNSLDITDEITLSVWIKPEPQQPSGHITIIGKRPDASGPNKYAINKGSGRTEYAGYVRINGGTHRAEDNVPASSYDGNTWVHFTLRYNGSAVSFHKNGVLIDYTLISGSIETSTGYLRFGDSFNGTIDEVGIWNRGLSAGEIHELYERGMQDGTHNVSIYASNIAGNQNDTTRYFTVDATAPDLTIYSPTNTTYTTSSVDLNYTVSDAANSVDWVGYSLDSGSNVTLGENATLTGLSEGGHNVTVYANDSLGNMGSDMEWFTIDTTAPSLVIVSPTNTSYTTSSVDLNYTVSDATSSVDWVGYSLDSQANVSLWWDSDWGYRQTINVTNNNDSLVLEEGYTVNVTFNMTDLVNQGKMNATGNDTRVVWYNKTDDSHNEIDRILEPSSGLKFDGVDDYVIVPDDASFDIGTGSFTVAAWFNTRNISAEQKIVDKMYDGNTGQWALEIGYSKFFLVMADTSGSTWTAYFGDTTPQPDTWYYVVGVFDNTNDLVYFYLNGKSDMTPTAKTDDCNSNDADVVIGAYALDYSAKFNGTIDEVAIWNRSLSAAEIAELYNNGIGRPISSEWVNTSAEGGDVNLVGLWHMDIDGYDNSTHIYDSSGLGNNGSISGAYHTNGYIVPNAEALNTIYFKTQENITNTTSFNGWDGNYSIYYGNALAGAVMDNESNVYLLYDNFDTDEWTNEGSGIGVNTGNSRLEFSIDRDSAGDNSYRAVTVTGGYELTYKIQLTSAVNNAQGVVGLSDTTNEFVDWNIGQGQRTEHRSTTIIKDGNGAPFIDVSYDPATSTTYLMKIKRFSSTTYFEIWDITGTTLHGSGSAIGGIGNYDYSIVSDYDGDEAGGLDQAGWIDDWRLRKYISPEPTSSFGGEETKFPNATLTGLSDGGHNVTVYANDSAGNIGSDVEWFTVDATAPALSIISPTNSSYATSSVDLNYTVTDATSSVDWVGYSLDSAGNVTVWWDSDWSYRKAINVTNQDASSPLQVNYTARNEFNLTECINDGKCNPNASDVRVVWYNKTGDSHNEIDRILEPSSALSFDGVDDRVNITDSDSLDFVNFTISAWIKPKSVSTTGAIVNKYTTTGDQRSYLFRLESGPLKAWICGPTGASGDCTSGTSTTNIVADVWTHVVLTFDNVTARFYINGTEEGSFTHSGGLYSGTSNLFIGWYSGTIFNGTIDEVAIFNRSLNATEIQWLYNGTDGKGPRPIEEMEFNTTGLAGYWHFDEKHGDVVADASVNDNWGNLSGAVFTEGKIVEESLRASGMSFDGADDYVGFGDVINMSTTNFTITSWFKTISNDVRQSIVSKGGSGHTVAGYRFGLDADNKISTFLSNGTIRFLASVTLVSGVDIDDGNYHHIAWRVNRGGNSEIFIDGISKITDDISAYATESLDTNYTFDIGTYEMGKGQFMSGSIDEVAIFNRTLNSSEIANLYNSGIGRSVLDINSSTDSLSGYWDFDGSNENSSIVQDLSGNDNDGERIGASWTIGKVGAIQNNTIRFKIQENVSIGGWDTNYSLYSENDGAGAAPTDVQDVFLDDGLVSYWSLDGHAIDIAGGNDGQIIGAVKASGFEDSGLSFDGVDDFVDIGGTTDFNFGTGDFSFFTWVYRNTDATTDFLFDKRSESTVGWGVWIRDTANDNVLMVKISAIQLFSTGGVSSGAWHLVGFVKSGNIVTYYIDGSPSGTGDYETESATATIIGKIGCRSFSTPLNVMNGTIDEVRIYNRALSAEEIASLYIASAPTTSLGGEETKFPNATLTGLSDGGHNVTVYANDSAGNIGSDVEWFTVDATAPDVVLLNPADNNVSTTDDLYFWFEANDSSSPILNASLWTNLSGTWALNRTNHTGTVDNNTEEYFQLDDIEDGNYIWNVNVSDINGNWQFASSNFTLTVGVPPDITIDSPTNTTYAVNTTDLNVSASETIDTWMYSLNSRDNLTFSPNITLGKNWWDGNYKYKKEINITNNNDSLVLEEGYTVNVTFNMTDLVNSGKMNATGNDTRIVWYNTTGDSHNEIDRILEPSSGLSFDGTNDYIDVGNGASLDTGNFITMAVWIKPASITGDRTVLRKNNQYMISTLEDGVVRVRVHTGSWDTLLSLSNLAIGNWYHIAQTYDGTTQRLYINGVENNDQSASGSITSQSDKLYIGSYALNGDYFNGTIDEVSIFNRSLSATEISELYNGGVGRPISSEWVNTSAEGGDVNLVGLWHFDDEGYDNSTYAHDSSGLENYGSISGAYHVDGYIVPNAEVDNTIWFKLQENITNTTSFNGWDGNYSVYYGNSEAGNPLENGSNVFLVYDDFNDNDLTTPYTWAEYYDVTADWTLSTADGTMIFTCSGSCGSDGAVSMSADVFGNSDENVLLYVKIKHANVAARAMSSGFTDETGVNPTSHSSSKVMFFTGTDLDLYIAGTGTDGLDDTTIVNNFVEWEFKTLGTSDHKFYQNNVLATTATTSQTDTTVAKLFVYGHNRNNQVITVDELTLRKYISPEPTTSLGGEEIVLSDGNYNITVYANDSAGNMGSDVEWFTVDTTAPDVALLTPTDNANLATDNVKFWYEANDSISNILNASLWTNLSGSWAFNGTNRSRIDNNTEYYISLNDIEDGNYIWNVNVSDILGNWQFASSNYTFTTNISGVSFNLGTDKATYEENDLLIINGTVNNTGSYDLDGSLSSTIYDKYGLTSLGTMSCNSTSLDLNMGFSEGINCTWTITDLLADDYIARFLYNWSLSYATEDVSFKVISAKAPEVSIEEAEEEKPREEVYVIEEPITIVDRFGRTVINYIKISTRIGSE